MSDAFTDESPGQASAGREVSQGPTERRVLLGEIGFQGEGQFQPLILQDLQSDDTNWVPCYESPAAHIGSHDEEDKQNSPGDDASERPPEREGNESCNGKNMQRGEEKRDDDASKDPSKQDGKVDGLCTSGTRGSKVRSEYSETPGFSAECLGSLRVLFGGLTWAGVGAAMLEGLAGLVRVCAWRVCVCCIIHIYRLVHQ